MKCGSLVHTVYNYEEFVERASNEQRSDERKLKRDSTMLRLIDAANLHCLLNLRTIDPNLSVL